MSRSIYLAVNWVNYPEESERSKLQLIAAESWHRITRLNPEVVLIAIGEQHDLVTAPDFMKKSPPLNRSARDVIKSDNRLPFLRDILGNLLLYPNEPSLNDWFGYMNSDVILKHDFLQLLTRLDHSGYTSIICRADEINIVDSLDQAYSSTPFRFETWGRDLFLFKRHGGEKLLCQLADYLIGKPTWDMDAYRILMAETNMHDDVDSSALSIHMNHERKWKAKSSIGRVYNEFLYCLKYRLNTPNQDGFYTKYLNRKP